jgi:hypothetical protein
MVSEKESRPRMSNTLDLLISATLHQSVGQAEPAPHVWKQIERRTRYRAAVEHAYRQTMMSRRPVPRLVVSLGTHYLPMGDVFPIL